MSQPNEQFEVGDRVCYIVFGTREYGTITQISTEVLSAGIAVHIYTIAMEEGGTFTGLSKHLRQA